MSPSNPANFIQRWHLRRGAPPASCIRCYQPHIDSFVFVYGDAEWTAGALIALTGIDADEALSTVEVMRRQHASKPDERHPANVRLCPACLAQCNVEVPLYTQAQIDQGGEMHGIIQTDEHMRRALGR